MSPERPLIGVGAVVVKDGSLLMIQRAQEPYEGRWSVPGGMLEHGEYISDAVKREVLEETGIEVEVGDLLGVLEFWREPHYVILDYVATPSNDAEPRAGGDVSDVRWIPLEEIPSMECTPRFVETLRGWGVLSTDE